MDKIHNAVNDGGRTEELEVSSSSVDEAGAVRSQMFSALADVEASIVRRYDYLSARMSRLEKRGSFFQMNDEVKTFLIMTGVSVAAAILVVAVQTAAESWRRS